MDGQNQPIPTADDDPTSRQPRSVAPVAAVSTRKQRGRHQQNVHSGRSQHTQNVHSGRSQRMATALVQVLGLAVWFSVSAVVPALRAEWGISSTAAVWLTGAVQVGFVVGAIGSAIFNLADRVPPHLLLAASAAAAAVCTILLSLSVSSMVGAIPLRFLTGVFLAGVYPVGMKLMVSWVSTAGRGLWLGVLLGALTFGSNLPQLISGLESLPWRTVLLVASALGIVGAVISVTLIRPGPLLKEAASTPSPRYVLTMFREHRPRLSNIGYFGHMWELYALWTWLPIFLMNIPAMSSFFLSPGVVAFLTMGLAGAIGCLIGGWGADRFGRAPSAVAALLVSGMCCLLSPLMFTFGPVVVLVLCTVWGASVIADSGVFSTALSETADPRFVGTALTAQTAIGFLVTVVSIQLIPEVADSVGWQFAFLVLAPGPVVGALAMRSFGTRSRSELAPNKG